MKKNWYNDQTCYMSLEFLIQIVLCALLVSVLSQNNSIFLVLCICIIKVVLLLLFTIIYTKRMGLKKYSMDCINIRYFQFD